MRQIHLKADLQHYQRIKITRNFCIDERRMTRFLGACIEN